MLRRCLPAALAVCAALFACDSAAFAGKDGGPAVRAAALARAAFGDGLADAERVLASATATLAGGLRAGTTSPRDAATGYLAAFTFFAGAVKKHADAASAALADYLSAAMVSEGDPALAGALSGDGGALDRFADSMQTSLDAARRRALARARRFAKALARAGTERQRMTVSLPAWTFAHRVAPAVPSSVEPLDDAPALLAVLAARLNDGTVIVGAAGRAAPALSGKFDVRLVGAAGVVAVGPFLSAGGMTVPPDGTWAAVSVLNDPQEGEGIDAGNRAVAFGVDPFDGGLAGRQPARYQHAGVIGVP
jgi:hypothetical protein